jgi:uncharacterized protein
MTPQGSTNNSNQTSHLRRWAKVLLVCAFTATVLLNYIAYEHARAMLYFTPAGEKTERPEDLGLSGKLRVLFTGINMPHPTNDRTPESLGLDYEIHRVVTDDGETLETWLVRGEGGRGIAVLFHGYSASKERLLQEASLLHEAGYSTLLVDFRGCGGSTGDHTTIGHDEARDVAATCRLAGSLDPGPVFLIGQSMGGAAVIRAAAHEEIAPAGLVLESVFATMLGTVRQRFELMGIPSWPSAELLVFWGGYQAGFSGFDHNPLEYASQVELPVLFLHGTEDHRAPIERARAVEAELRGEARFVEFSGVSHGSLCETDPELWKESVVAFFESCAGTR